MPMTCSICRHPQRRAIDKMLLSGESKRRIAARFHLSDSSVHRHAHRHLGKQLEKAMLADMQSLIREMNRLHGHVNGVLQRGEQASDDKLILLAVSQGVRNVEVLARLGTQSDVERELEELRALVDEREQSDHDDA